MKRLQEQPWTRRASLSRHLDELLSINPFKSSWIVFERVFCLQNVRSQIWLNRKQLSVIEQHEGVYSFSHGLCQGENNEKNLQSKGRCWNCAAPFVKIEWFWLVYLSEPLFCNGLLKIQVRVREKIPETKVSQWSQTGKNICAHTWILRTSIKTRL